MGQGFWRANEVLAFFLAVLAVAFAVVVVANTALLTIGRQTAPVERDGTP